MKQITIIKSASLVFILVLIVFAPGCKKDNAMSVVPAITFDSLSPDPAIKYRDSVLIVISYLDGDGDLGIDSADVKNLFVTDSRNSVVSQFRIPQLAPSGSNVAIQGKIDIVLPPQVFVNDNDTVETATYSIYVTDRAGHQSNTVNTNPLMIKLR